MAVPILVTTGVVVIVVPTAPAATTGSCCTAFLRLDSQQAIATSRRQAVTPEFFKDNFLDIIVTSMSSKENKIF